MADHTMVTDAWITDNYSMDLVIFAIGATGYSVIEYIFRGYTHWSMALTGGACLLVFYYYTREHMQVPAVLRGAVGACIFTVFEFFVGLLVNLGYGWHVWDYTGQPGNILGQICPLFSFVWFLIGIVLSLMAESINKFFKYVKS